MSDLCKARSKPLVQAKPDSYLICSNDPGHAGDHTACDGHGHVLGRWKSPDSVVEVWTPMGKVIA